MGAGHVKQSQLRQGLIVVHGFLAVVVGLGLVVVVGQGVVVGEGVVVGPMQHFALVHMPLQLIPFLFFLSTQGAGHLWQSHVTHGLIVVHGFRGVVVGLGLAVVTVVHGFLPVVVGLGLAVVVGFGLAVVTVVHGFLPVV